MASTRGEVFGFQHTPLAQWGGSTVGQQEAGRAGASPKKSPNPLNCWTTRGFGWDGEGKRAESSSRCQLQCHKGHSPPLLAVVQVLLLLSRLMTGISSGHVEAHCSVWELSFLTKVFLQDCFATIFCLGSKKNPHNQPTLPYLSRDTECTHSRADSNC